MFIEFVIQNQFFSYSLKEFAQILDIPCESACVFTDKWSLDELAYGVPTDGPYQTNPPSPDDIISSIRIDQEGQVCRIRHEEEIDVLEYQILTREIVPTLKPLEEIIQENVFCLGSEILEKDRGMRRGRHFTSSSSAFDQPSSSHLNDDDDDDGNGEGMSRASIPLPVRYVNSITNEVPQVFQNPPNIDPHLEPFYTRQTEIINRQVQILDEHGGGLSDEDVTTTPSPTTTSSSPTPPNAPSRTTSTNQTSLSKENTSTSFQSKLQISPPSSNEPTSPHPLNPLLDNISNVPPRPLNSKPL
nr:DNA helicase Pif1-like protein [Tanacetum cinerariifolium]